MRSLITQVCATIALFLAVTLSTGSLEIVRAQEPAAVIVTCTGDVQILAVDSTPRDATFGDHLSPGETLRTAAESTVEFVLPNGTLLRLGPDSEMQVGSPAAGHDTAPSVGGSKGFEDVQQLVTLKDHRGTSAMSALRSSSGVDAIDDLQPRETAILPGRPTFHWTTTDSTAAMALRIYVSGALHHETIVEDTTAWTYPEDAPALTPGSMYSWFLEVDDPFAAPLRSPTAFFHVIHDEDAAALEARLATIGEAGASPLARAILRASAFRSHGLVRDAVHEIEAHRRESSSPELDRVLVQLLIESGRAADAVTVLDGAED
mgnify:CR=1 FL=1